MASPRWRMATAILLLVFVFALPPMLEGAQKPERDSHGKAPSTKTTNGARPSSNAGNSSSTTRKPSAATHATLPSSHPSKPSSNTGKSSAGTPAKPSSSHPGRTLPRATLGTSRRTAQPETAQQPSDGVDDGGNSRYTCKKAQDVAGNEVTALTHVDEAACRAACDKSDACTFYAFVKDRICHLKRDYNNGPAGKTAPDDRVLSLCLKPNDVDDGGNSHYTCTKAQDVAGDEVTALTDVDEAACRAACDNSNACTYYVFVKGRICHLKRAYNNGQSGKTGPDDRVLSLCLKPAGVDGGGNSNYTCTKAQDVTGNEVNALTDVDEAACRAACESSTACTYYVFVKGPICHLKRDYNNGPSGVTGPDDRVLSLCLKPGTADATFVDVTSESGTWMRWLHDDAGSGARDDLVVFRPSIGFWFGHTAINPGGQVKGMLFLPHNPYTSTLVAPPTKWTRMWGLRKCGVGKRDVAFGLWCPEAPFGFVALGCVYRRTDCGGGQADNDPPSGWETEGFMTLRRDLVLPGRAEKVWSDQKSGAQDDGAVWRVVAQGAGFSPGVMIAQPNYDAPDPARLFVIDTSKLHVTTWANASWNVPGVVVDSHQSAQTAAENAALAKFAPTVRFMQDEEAFPSSIEDLLAKSSLMNAKGQLVKAAPMKPSDLAAAAAAADTYDYYLTVQEDAWPGRRPVNNEVLAPMYASVKYLPSGVVALHYFQLYNWQGGLPVRADRAGTQFNCIIGSYNEHQGDIEHIVVHVKPDFSDIVDGAEAVQFEHHGDLVSWNKSQVIFDRGTHPVAYAARNGHASYNAAVQPGSDPEEQRFGGDKEPEEDFYYYLDGVRNVVLILDFVSGKGKVNNLNPIWAPWQHTGGIVRIGINKDKTPYNDQTWVMFKGRFGKHQDNSLTYAHYMGGSNLETFDWAYVKLVNLGALALRKIKEDYRHGDGPRAFGDCFRPICSD